MSNTYNSLSHSKWDCKYHLVFIPKYRKKVLYGNIRKELGKIFHELARQKECNMAHTEYMVLPIQFNNSEKKKLFISNSSNHSPKSFQFCIKRFC